MRLVLRCCALLIPILGMCSPAYGQAVSPSYTLATGSFVATGGVSTATSTAVVASIPATTTSSTTSSTTYTVSSGVIGVAYSTSALTASYAGGAVQTVTPADYLLKVAFAGDTGTATGYFYYRYGGGTSYTSVAMAPGTGDTLEYLCPAIRFNIRGLEYYFQIFRGNSIYSVGTPTSPYTFRVSLTNEQCRSFDMGPRIYAIVGVPIAVTGGNTVTDVFQDDLGAYDREVWRLGRWDAATESYREFPNAPAVVPGRGYWVITRDIVDFGAAGVTVMPNETYGGNRYLSIPLEEGWNQIANPFPFPVSMLEMVINDNGTMTTDPTGIMDDVGYYYDGEHYFTQTTFDDWDGVFLHVEKTGVELWVGYHAAGSSKPVVDGLRVERNAPAWQLELTLQSGERSDIQNYIGVCSDAVEGADVYDYREPPMAPEGVMLAYRLPDGSDGLRRTDFRPEFTDGATWEVVFSEGSERVLKANGLESIPDDMEAWLLLTDADMIKLEGGKEIALPNDVSSAQLLIGKEAYIAGEASSALPKNFALGQNFPNPFNPSTTIRIALPTTAKVELKVYNLLGQKVATVVDEEMPAGNHTVVWEGRSDSGALVASGVYFYRLKAGDFRQTKKMLLLK